MTPWGSPGLRLTPTLSPANPATGDGCFGACVKLRSGFVRAHLQKSFGVCYPNKDRLQALFPRIAQTPDWRAGACRTLPHRDSPL